MNRAQKRQAEKANGDAWFISTVQKRIGQKYNERDLFLHLDASNPDPNTNRYIPRPGTVGACVWKKVNGDALIEDVKKKEGKNLFLVNFNDVVK